MIYVEINSPLLLADGGFEHWASPNNLTYWSESVSGSSTINQDGTVKDSGNYSVRFDIDGDNSIVNLSVAAALKASTQYTMEVVHKESDSATMIAQLRDGQPTPNYMNVDGVWSPTAAYLPMVSLSELGKYILIFTTPAWAGNYRILFTRNDAASRSIWIDSVSIKETASVVSTRNLIVVNALTHTPNTCSFTLEAPSMVPLVGHEVVCREEDAFGQVFFTGTVTSVKQTKLAPCLEYNQREYIYDVECQDFTRLLDRYLIDAEYANKTSKYIVDDILSNFTDVALGFTDTNTETSDPIPYIKFDMVPVTSAIQQLAEYLDWDWYVDYEKDIHLFEKESRVAPFDIDDTAVTTKINKFSLTPDYSQVRNRVYVIGGHTDYEFEYQNETGNGSTTSWNLAHEGIELKAEVEYPAMTYHTYSVGIEGKQADDGSYEMMWSPSGKTIHMGSGHSAPPSGALITITYKYKLQVTSVYNHSASQAAIAAVEGGSGVYEHVIRDSSVTNQDVADAMAEADAAKHALPNVTGSFETFEGGFVPGQYLSITVPGYEAFHGNYQIQRVTVRGAGPSAQVYTVSFAKEYRELKDFLIGLAKVISKTEKKIIEATAKTVDSTAPGDGQDGVDGIDGDDGVNGAVGPGILFRGEFSPTTVYYNRSNRRDAVKYLTTHYLFKGTDGTSGAWNASNWENFGSEFSSIATGLLLAENANITTILTIGDAEVQYIELSGPDGTMRFIDGDGLTQVLIDANIDGTGAYLKIGGNDGQGYTRVSPGKVVAIENSLGAAFSGASSDAGPLLNLSVFHDISLYVTPLFQVDGDGNVYIHKNPFLTPVGGNIIMDSGCKVDGYDVSALGSKLSSIEDEATADQTAAEILTLLLGVDGSGTDLDADKLDGNHASAFATAGHNHDSLYAAISHAHATLYPAIATYDTHVAAKGPEQHLPAGGSSGQFVNHLGQMATPPNATTSSPGYMSATDKQNLNACCAALGI